MVIYLNIGSNIEPRLTYINRAISLLRQTKRVKVSGYSRIYETPPAGMSPQSGNFFNMCVMIRTGLRAGELLRRTEEIEAEVGRPPSSKGKKLPRVIDLDHVLAERLTLNLPQLKLPHPGLLQRSFFLWPLLEIAPNVCNPTPGQPLRYQARAQVSPPILRTFAHPDAASWF